jgi:hypothetical protein
MRVVVLTWWLERKPELAPLEVDEVFLQLIFTGVCESRPAPDG